MLDGRFVNNAINGDDERKKKRLRERERRKKRRAAYTTDELGVILYVNASPASGPPFPGCAGRRSGTFFFLSAPGRGIYSLWIII